MKKKIKFGRFFASVCAITFVIVIGIAIFRGLGSTESVAGSYELGANWKVTINDEVYENVNLESFNFPLVGKGDVVTLERYLPDKLADGAVMQFYTMHSAIIVAVGGRTVYSYGYDLMEAGRLLGYGYNFIQLPENAENMLLHITLIATENNAFGNLDVPKIGAGVNIMRNFLVERKAPAAISFFLMMFGVIFVFATIFFSFDGPDFYRLLCIAFFALCMGIWNMCNYDLISLFTYNMRMKSVLEFSSLYGAPTFIFGYFHEQATKNGSKLQRIAYYVILGIQVAFVAISSFCQQFRIINFPDFLTCSHIIMVIMIVYVLILFLRNSWKKQMENFVLLSGVAVMAAIVAWDLIRYNIQLYFGGLSGGHFMNYTYLGTFIFILTLILDFIQKISHSLYISAENQTLEKFAYTDELTGLLNRRRCEEIYDEVDSYKSDYVLIAFDLNNLKKVNDTLGHEVGDQYIREFGNVLKDVFGRYEAIRTGGDEFIVVARDAFTIDVPKCLEEMERKIAAVNKRYTHWNMSTAYGVVYAREDRERTIRESNKVADERMYEKKFEMKGTKRR